MEGSSPSLDLGEELQRVLKQFTTPNPPMDAQIQTTKELEENMEVEIETSISEMKIFKQKTTQEGDASTHGSRTTGSLGALGVHDYTEHFTTQQVFPNEQELKDWIFLTGLKHGFVIIVKSSETMTKNRRPQIRFQCERSGKFRPFIPKNSIPEDKKRKRNTGTKKCECPFQLWCVKAYNGWSVKVYNGNHNHPPASQFEGHAYPGRLKKEEIQMVVEASKTLVKPRDILMTIKNRDPSNCTTIKTIYNARTKYRVMGHIVASAFKVALVFLSEKQCLTFLPLHCTPLPPKRMLKNNVSTMGYVNNNHFIQLYMRPGFPMPPIALNWQRYQETYSIGWETPFRSQIEQFGRIIGSDVATVEGFDIVE